VKILLRPCKIVKVATKAGTKMIELDKLRHALAALLDEGSGERHDELMSCPFARCICEIIS
jgi:hypothetical protein